MAVTFFLRYSPSQFEIRKELRWWRADRAARTQSPVQVACVRSGQSPGRPWVLQGCQGAHLVSLGARKARVGRGRPRPQRWEVRTQISVLHNAKKNGKHARGRTLYRELCFVSNEGRHFSNPVSRVRKGVRCLPKVQISLHFDSRGNVIAV